MIPWPRLDFVVLCAAFCFFPVRGVASKEQLAYFDVGEEEAWRCCLVWCSGFLFLLVLLGSWFWGVGRVS